MKDRFTAEKTNWQGEGGYQVKQYHDGKVVCSQFVPNSCFEKFCEEAGIEPEMAG